VLEKVTLADIVSGELPAPLPAYAGEG
jgi:hypothetical protein